MTADKTGDEALMSAFGRSGDEKLFEELVRRHTQKALAAARAFLGDDSTAEDAVQEAFLRLIRARADYNPVQPFSSWFFTILRNLCRDELHRRARQRPLAEHSGAQMERATAADPEAQVVLREEFETALAAVHELSVEDREILLLRIQAGWNFEEIAVYCELSPAAAKKRSYRALERLRRRLAPAGEIRKS